MTKSKKPKTASSKALPPTIREIIPVTRHEIRRRDPRFDDACGRYNQDLFKKSYFWIDEKYAEEKSGLKRQISKSKDPMEKEILQRHLTSLESREEKIKEKEAERSLFKEIKKSEEALIEKGKKPFFLKRTDKKKLLLIQKYKKALADGANIDEILEKRKRHTASHQHKHLPSRRSKDQF